MNIKKRELFLNNWILIHIVYLLALASPLPFRAAFAQQTTSSYMNNVIKPYIASQASTYNTVEQNVKANITNWANNPSLGQFYMGNWWSSMIFDLQNDWLTEVQTLLCNMSESGQAQMTTHFHSYDDLHDGADISGGSCKIDIEYSGSGLIAGRCFSIISIYPWCPVFQIWSDLVDYLYPVQKTNISSQPFYSRYLTFMEVFPAKIQLLLQLSWATRFKVWLTLFEFFRWRNAPFPSSIPPSNIPLLWNSNFHTEAWLQQTRERGFSRFFPEEEIADDDEWYIPHWQMEQPQWTTDIDAYDLAYWLKDTKSHDKSSYKKFMKNPEDCARNNMATGKTPDFPTKVKSAWTANSSAGSSGRSVGRCLDDVGETIPYQAWHRPHISDGFFQTLFKGLKAYNKESSHRNKIFTYRHDIDRWHFFPSFLSSIGANVAELNDSYRKDIQNDDNRGIFQCRPMDQITRPNLQWSDVNVPVVGSKEETTIERFNHFSGCWGFKGLAFWMLAFRWMPSVFGPVYNLRLR